VIDQLEFDKAELITKSRKGRVKLENMRRLGSRTNETIGRHVSGPSLRSIGGSLSRLRRRTSRADARAHEMRTSETEELDNSLFNDESKQNEENRTMNDGDSDGRVESNLGSSSSPNLNDSIEKRRLIPCTSASGMSQADLRKTIRDLQLDTTISHEERAKRMQELMTFSWRKSQENMNQNGSMRKRSSRNLKRHQSTGNVNDESRPRVGSNNSSQQNMHQRSQSSYFAAQSVASSNQDMESETLDDESDYDEDVEAYEDAFASYRDEESKVFGCEHYSRNCMVSAPCCDEFFPCRFCHNDEMDHEIDRYAVNRVRCMGCGAEQAVSNKCINCKLDFARYYCEPCKFFDNTEGKQIYHCPHCNICRIGEGLGIDYFHCHRCNACMSITLKDHKCVERSLESDCPVCHEFMFTSTIPVMFLPCGHCMHVGCYETYTATNYVCPICGKSLGDMAAYFARIDEMLENERMPEEFVGLRSRIFCADCEIRSVVPYHFVYHKCSDCGSYNTKVLEQLPRD